MSETFVIQKIPKVHVNIAKTKACLIATFPVVIPATILYDHLSKEINTTISIDKRGLRYLDKSIYQFDIIDTPKYTIIIFIAESV